MSKKPIELDKIKICSNENAENSEKETLSKRLNMSVSTWLKLYESQTSAEYRARLRDVSILMAKKFRSDNVYISEHGSFNTKFAASAPYYFFLTSVDNAELTHNQPYSVAFHEIIDYTTGELIDSLHINYMAEMLWLINEYMLAAQVPKMTVLYGIWLDPEMKYEIPFDIEFVNVEMSEFGCHHSKISIFKYTGDKIRIMISSSNIYAEDWQSRTQGLWISPFLPLLPADANDSDGESPTNFKRDFLQYLSAYSQPEILGWSALIHRADCSAINVFFIASVPGHHDGSSLDTWGHRKLAALLSAHASLPSDAQKWPVIAQSSSVGVFGPNYQSWLSSTIVRTMSREKDKKIIIFPEFKFIFPSKNNYNQSYDNQIGSSCLMYGEKNSLKQQWLKDYLYQWKSDKIGRTQAMPHLKCYTRISPDESEMAWFFLTSANLGKGAMGKMLRNGTLQTLCNYEAGVLFLPQFILNQNTFPIKEPLSPEAPVFLLPYDLPPTPYEPDDEPYVTVVPPDAIEAEEIQTPDTVAADTPNLETVMDVDVNQVLDTPEETSNLEEDEYPNETSESEQLTITEVIE